MKQHLVISELHTTPSTPAAPRPIIAVFSEKFWFTDYYKILFAMARVIVEVDVFFYYYDICFKLFLLQILILT